MYGPCQRTAPARSLLSQLLDWAQTIMARLPRRCTVVGFADMNARVGSIPACDCQAAPVIGTCRAQRENEHGRVLREWCSQASMQLVNTLDPSSAGPTWSGGARAQSRPDYLMKQSHSAGDILRTWVAYTLAMEI